MDLKSLKERLPAVDLSGLRERLPSAPKSLPKLPAKLPRRVRIPSEVRLPKPPAGSMRWDRERGERLAEALPYLFYALMLLAFVCAVTGSAGSGLLLLILGAVTHLGRVGLEGWLDPTTIEVPGRGRNRAAAPRRSQVAAARAPRPRRSEPLVAAAPSREQPRAEPTPVAFGPVDLFEEKSPAALRAEKRAAERARAEANPRRQSGRRETRPRPEPVADPGEREPASLRPPEVAPEVTRAAPSSVRAPSSLSSRPRRSRVARPR